MTVSITMGTIESSAIRRDLDATGIEYIVVGSISSDRQVTVEYSIELPASGRAITGTVILNQDGIDVDLNNMYSYTEPEIETVLLSADILGTNLRLIVETNGLGENPVMTYKRTALPVA